jgi:hypothetical protein
VLPVLFALAGRFVITWSVVAAALAVGVSLAALADGRPPRWERLTAACFGFAPAAAAIWRLLDLCRHQAQVAWSAMGARPAHLCAFLMALALPLMAADRPTDVAGLHATQTRLEAPDMQIEWRDGAAWRADLDAPFVGLPPPNAMPPIRRNPLWILVLRAIALGLGLLALLRAPDAARLPLGACLAVLVFWIGR